MSSLSDETNPGELGYHTPKSWGGRSRLAKFCQEEALTIQPTQRSTTEPVLKR